MRRSRKEKNKKPKGSVDVTIFYQGDILQGTRDAYGNVFAEDGNIYQYSSAEQKWKNAKDGSKLGSAKQQNSVKTTYSKDKLGEIVVMDDGSAYQYQDVEGIITLVCVLKHPPAFVPLSYVHGASHGHISARSPGR